MYNSEKRIAKRSTKRFLIQVIKAADALHKLGYEHGDLHAGNLLIADGGHAKGSEGEYPNWLLRILAKNGNTHVEIGCERMIT